MDKNVKLAGVIALVVVLLGAGVMAMMRGSSPAPAGAAATAEGPVSADEKTLVDREATGTPAPGAPATGTGQ
jgi:hypothetical protein